MLRSGSLRWPVVLVAGIIAVAIVAVAGSVGLFSGRRQVNPTREPVPQSIPSTPRHMLIRLRFQRGRNQSMKDLWETS